MMVWKMIFLFQGCLVRFHVKLQGCIRRKAPNLTCLEIRDAPHDSWVEKDPAAAAAAVMADAAALAVMPTGAVSRVPGCLVSIGGRSHV